MKLVFMGPPGAGKGTIAEHIIGKYSFAHISPGQELRNEVSKNSELGKKIKAIFKTGDLVPDDWVYTILRERLTHDDCKNGFVLDGFPRNLTQAKKLKDITSIDLVIMLKVPDNIVIERLSNRRICSKCGENFNLKNIPPKVEGICDHCGGELIHRTDDTPKIIKHRLEVYHKMTEVVYDFYLRKNCIVEVDASGNVKEIVDNAINAIENYLEKRNNN